MNKETLFKEVCEYVDRLNNDIQYVSKTIFNNPELAYKEYQSSMLLEQVAENNGFVVERGKGELNTALRATYNYVDTSPSIAFISEYDALPNGHSCGHNLIAASGIYSSIIFNKLVKKHNLKVNSVFLGTPAEEGGGGKIKMLEAGMFHDIDAAMMIHPCDSTMVEDWSLAGQTLTFHFHGRSAHCAASPWLGANALAAATETVNMLNAWRSQFKDYTRIFPNIHNGGEATNVIPAYTKLLYNVRSDDKDYHKELVKIVENCAECSAKAFGVTVETERSIAYEPVKNDKKLEKYMQEAFEMLGENVIPRYKDHGIGSTDMGNISQALPAIHGHLFLTHENTHTDAFREAAGGTEGSIYVVKAIKAMVMTALGYYFNELEK